VFQRWKLAALAAAVVVVAVVIAVVVVSRTSSSSPGVVAAVSQSAGVSPGSARTTVQALTTPGEPLDTLVNVGNGLVADHDVTQCRSAETELASAGTPTTLHETAGELPDPLAADLTADVVTAVGQVLADCDGGSGPTEAAMATLSNATAGLQARIKADRGS
jgi:hypothetical protein